MTAIQNERFLPSLISYPMNVLTLQDVILDSPAFRSNIEQVADQSERFEKWLDNIVRTLKLYLESLSKVNTQTSHLWKQLAFDKLDHAFICNSQVAALSVNGFANALKCSLSAKVKLMNDLDETLLRPLQNLLKSDLKEFKDMRKTFEKTLDKYENHCSRYANLSKQKEPSALREDAFQMFDIQKTYVRASGAYFMQLATLKSKVEHLLVDCFSGALTDHLDHLNETLVSQNSARGMVSGWRQWLDESKAACSYQLGHIRNSTQALEEVYIRQIRPHRSIKQYSTSNNGQLATITNSPTFESQSDDSNEPHSSDTDPKMGSSTSLPSSTSFGDIHTSLLVKQPSSSSSTSIQSIGTTQLNSLTKQGYLFSRVVVGKPSRYSWVRRWFFLKDGWFGQYTVSTVNKVKGSMTISNRISVNNKCQCNVFTDIDRRFCFEVTGFESSFLLQAESEQDMQQWLWTIEKAKDFYEKEQQISNNHTTGDAGIPHALLSPKADTTIRRSTNDNSQLLVSLSVSPLTISSSYGLPTGDPSPLASDYLINDLSTTSALTTLMIQESYQTSVTANSDKDSINSKISSGSMSENQPSLSGCRMSSGGDTSQLEHSVRRYHSASTTSSWSMPWLMSGINALSSAGCDLDSSLLNGWIMKSCHIQDPDAYVIWPNKMELDAPKVTLDNYSGDLATGQREIRRYFASVPKEEIVLDVFSASLYRQSRMDGVENGDDCSESGNKVGNYYNGGQRVMHNGNGYSGTVYVTQKRLWFYSCRMMTCVNAAVISLSSVKSIRLEKVLSGQSQGMLMYIDTKPAPASTYCFGLWLESAELVAERLRVVVQNAKRTEKLNNQALFDMVRCITIGKIRSKTPTSQLIATSTSNATVTALTVQAQSRLTTEPQPNFDHIANDDTKSSTPPSVASSFSDSSGFSTAKVSMERQQQNTSPAAGALAAAMEAANEARLAKSKARLIKKSSKSNMEENSNPPLSSLADDTSNKSDRQSNQPSSENNNTAAITLKPLLTKPVTCNCDDHLEKMEADLELPTSALKLYQFISEMSCWDQLNKSKGNSAPAATQWKHMKSGTIERTLDYLMPNPMVKSKEAEVIETQQILKNDDGLCYVIMITTKTPTLPYADAFIPMIKICITYTSPTTCRLVCNIGVKWLKSIMVKGMVNRAAFKGMSDTISALTPIIEQAALQDKDSTTNGSLKQQKQQMVTGATESTVKQQGTPARRPSSEQGGDARQERKIVKPNILSGTTLSPQLILIFVGVALLLLFYRTCIMGWTKSAISVPSFPISPSMDKISWRAVHLADLEPLMNGEVKEMDRRNSSAYQTFKISRSDISGGWNYRWLNIRYRLIAAELAFTREQLAVIRYELLTAFKMLNGMEQRLMESEYWTWLLDQRKKCDVAALGTTAGDANRRPAQPDFSHLLLCNEVNDELNHI